MATQPLLPAHDELVIQPNVYYTVDEAAHLLRVSRAAVLRLVRTGRLAGVSIGRRRRILGAALLRLTPAPEPSAVEESSFWREASRLSLSELWDNDADAVYDSL
ncbi:MAG: helix-turn-helix domain-containing protein [Armatimonadetes bacterium]|nr:helix-turn-helix domain-containing protein [Armatimonadota bacterium]